jgi:transglutaminase-like putative cysteine protease
MEISITHDTCYDYQPAVETAQHIACLQPRHGHGQERVEHDLQIEPPPAQCIEQIDAYGNVRCFFSLQTLHSTLRVCARSVIRTSPARQPVSNRGWQEQAKLFQYHAGAVFDAATEFVFDSPLVQRLPVFADYVQPCLAPGSSVLAVAQALMEKIHHEFTYDSQSTQVNTPAVQALQLRRGVCQDFAHIMLACLRSIGLAARYVSGYLLTEAAPGSVKLIGSDASHAWVSVYAADLPDGARWCDFDPTNNRWGWPSPGEDYVTVAIGRDFSDVSPLRGVIHGGANHTLTVGVTVQALSKPLK